MFGHVIKHCLTNVSCLWKAENVFELSVKVRVKWLSWLDLGDMMSFPVVATIEYRYVVVV